MSRTNILIMVGVAFVVGVAVGTIGLLWSTGRISEPSRDIAEVAPTLVLNPTAEPSVLILEELNALNAKVDSLATQVASGVSVQPNPNPDSTAPDSTEGSNSDSVPDRALFRITNEESQARFRIFERILGNETEVVGTTRQVAGDIIVNFTDPTGSQVGTIAINARTLRTDTDLRDQSIRGQILQSSDDENEFIIFEPLELQNLPTESVAVGDSIAFQIVGNLTVRGVTRPVTFEANVTVDSAEQISGLASTLILYPDFGIVVNPPPNISDVSDEVTLEIEFVALRVEDE